MKWRIGLLCALLVFICAISTDTAQMRVHRLVRNMLESYANSLRNGGNHGQHLVLVWSVMPEDVRLIAPMMVTLTKKLLEDLWEATDRNNRTILIKVTRTNAAHSLEANRRYVIPDIRQYDEELEREVHVVEGDLIRPLDVEDP